MCCLGQLIPCIEQWLLLASTSICNILLISRSEDATRISKDYIHLKVTKNVIYREALTTGLFFHIIRNLNWSSPGLLRLFEYAANDPDLCFLLCHPLHVGSCPPAYCFIVKDGCCTLSLMSLFQVERITKEERRVPVSETEKLAMKPNLNFISWHYEKWPTLVVQKGDNCS